MKLLIFSNRMDASKFALTGVSIAAITTSALVIACGPDAPAKDPASVPSSAPTGASSTTTSVTPPRFDDAGLSEVAPVAPTTTATPSAPITYPPPKPVVIALTHADGSIDDAELKLADDALAAQDFAGALAHETAALKLAPKDVAPKIGMLRTRIAKAAPDFGYASARGNRDVASATSDLKKIVDAANPPSGQGFAELGRAELLLGDAQNAVIHLRRAVELIPQEVEAHSALGVALLASGDAPNALGSLKRSVELDFGSAPRHGNLGTVYFMLGQVADAVHEYEIEVKLADAEPRAHSDLGTALLASNDPTRGIAELRRALALDPSRATFHSNLGYALQLEGKRDEAIAEYRESLRLDPKLVSAWVNLATVLAKDPKTRAEARRALETAKKIDPQDPRVKINTEELDALEKGQILR